MLQATLLFEQTYNIFDSVFEIAIVCPVLSAQTPKPPWDSTSDYCDHVAPLIAFTLCSRPFQQPQQRA
jgi:hypothetical protein